MSSANTTRVIVTKAVLWALVGVATTVAAARYVRGLGATTALSDATPWGLWIGFDVLSGVALAAGGFVIAATVHIFHLDRYHGIVRPAVLTAFLGYVAVALGLMADLGRPWNIWRMIVFWQPHSPLFEVGWCVMLYLTVLALEFAPVVFEGLRWERSLRLMRRATLALVIAGIGLSTLHQSSLGTLFLLARDRMHPLWYSPILPLLFFVSAVALGLMMVTTESVVTGWLYRRDPEWPLLRGLTRAAAVVIALYLALRFADIAWRGLLHHAVDGSWYAVLFWVELTLSALLSLLLFTVPRWRERSAAVAAGALVGTAGFVLHRIDVGGMSHVAATGEPYLPALTELAVSVGLVAAMVLVFLFLVERLPVWEEPPLRADHFSRPFTDRASGLYFGGTWFGRSHLAALSWVLGAVAGVVVLELTTADRAVPRPVEVRNARAVAAERLPLAEGVGFELAVVDPPHLAGGRTEALRTALLIDGDQTGTQVLFDHQDHQRRLGGQLSCGACHHLNRTHDRGTACAECHRDMYQETDTFGHEAHVEALGGNRACRRCHLPPDGLKTRAAAPPCRECHRPASSPAWTVRADGVRTVGVAPGYRDALHGLCIGCHRTTEVAEAVAEPRLVRCPTCHRGVVPELGPGPAGVAVVAAALERP